VNKGVIKQSRDCEGADKNLRFLTVAALTGTLDAFLNNSVVTQGNEWGLVAFKALTAPMGRSMIDEILHAVFLITSRLANSMTSPRRASVSQDTRHVPMGKLLPPL
jgi:hypothetical protein